MSIIVYRDGVLATDSLALAGSERMGTIRKIFRSPAGHVGAGCGRVSLVQAFGRWLEAGLPDGVFDAKADDDDDFGAILVHPDGRVVGLTCDGYEFAIDAPWLADGEAAALARGTLAMGATAEQAVEIAIKYHIRCGGPVQSARTPVQDSPT